MELGIQPCRAIYGVPEDGLVVKAEQPSQPPSKVSETYQRERSERSMRIGSFGKNNGLRHCNDSTRHLCILP